MAQRWKRLPAVQETWVQSLGQENPLEEDMAIHSKTLAWKITWTEEPGGLQKEKSKEEGAAEDELVRWHHRLNGQEFEQTLKDSGG